MICSKKSQQGVQDSLFYYDLYVTLDREHFWLCSFTPSSYWEHYDIEDFSSAKWLGEREGWNKEKERAHRVVYVRNGALCALPLPSNREEIWSIRDLPEELLKRIKDAIAVHQDEVLTKLT